MNGFMLLQASQTVAAKSADMLEKDPHGVIITLVSVLVVFAALVVLYFAYTFIGKISSGQISFKFPERQRKAKKAEDPSGTPAPEIAAAIAMALDQEMNGEVYAAIGMAMHQYLNDTVHDMESYIITIRRR